MRVQELTAPLHRLTPWRAAVALAMVLVLSIFVAELIWHLDGNLLRVLEFAELSALLVLFVDLAVNFSRAESKTRFIRKNWLELMLFVPFAFTFEALRAYEVFNVMGFEAMPFLMRTRVFVKGGHVATHISRSEPARLARAACSEMVCAPDRYKTMKYRGLLSY